jgi:hypothetical protein
MASGAGAGSAASEPRSLSILFGAREGWPLAAGRVCGHMMTRERALPEWAETPLAPRALARSTRPKGTCPCPAATTYAAGVAGASHCANTLSLPARPKMSGDICYIKWRRAVACLVN